jgi:hypothetical protein
MKRIPLIMSRGLSPDISPKNKSWGDDPNTDVLNLDKTSYGGIYVTQNLVSATSAAFRTSRKDNAGRAVVILSLQPRSLMADEDDFASRLKDLKGTLAGSIYHHIYPYMWEVYGAPSYHKKWADEKKDEWVNNSIESLFYDFKLSDPRLKEQTRQMLHDEGYKAMLTRTVSYLKKDEDRTDYWEWRKAYADIHGLKDYGEEVEIPDPPAPQAGERIFRAFIDKLTRTMKHKARHSFTGSFSKTARSLQPVGFHGKNRIIAIAEIVSGEVNKRLKRPMIYQSEKYFEYIRILYGELPEDFKIQWKERIGDLRIVK